MRPGFEEGTSFGLAVGKNQERKKIVTARRGDRARKHRPLIRGLTYKCVLVAWAEGQVAWGGDSVLMATG